MQANRVDGTWPWLTWVTTYREVPKTRCRSPRKKTKNFMKFARNNGSTAGAAASKRARFWRAFCISRRKAALKQSDNLPLRVHVDRIGRRHLWQAGHDHYLTADRHHQLVSGLQPD